MKDESQHSSAFVSNRQTTLNKLMHASESKETLSIEPVLAIEVLLLVGLAAQDRFRIPLCNHDCLLLVRGPRVSAVTHPRTVKPTAAAALVTLVRTWSAIVFDMFVFASAPQNPSTLRDEKEEVLAAAAARRTREIRFTTSASFVLFQAMSTQTSAFAHDRYTFI